MLILNWWLHLGSALSQFLVALSSTSNKTMGNQASFLKLTDLEAQKAVDSQPSKNKERRAFSNNQPQVV